MPTRKSPGRFGPHVTRRDFLNGVALGAAFEFMKRREAGQT